MLELFDWDEYVNNEDIVLIVSSSFWFLSTSMGPARARLLLIHDMQSVEPLFAGLVYNRVVVMSVLRSIGFKHDEGFLEGSTVSFEGEVLL